MSDPYYRDYTVEQISEYIQKIIYFETTIVPKTDEKDFNPFDPVTLQPLSARVPVSDIREALSWDKYKKTGKQNYILISFESFKQAK